MPKLLFVLHFGGGDRDHSSSWGPQCTNRQGLMLVISLIYSKTVIIPLAFHLQTQIGYFKSPSVRLTKYLQFFVPVPVWIRSFLNWDAWACPVFQIPYCLSNDTNLQLLLSRPSVVIAKNSLAVLVAQSYHWLIPLANTQRLSSFRGQSVTLKEELFFSCGLYIFLSLFQ